MTTDNQLQALSDPVKVAAATNRHLDAVSVALPHLINAAKTLGMTEIPAIVAMIATVATECSFAYVDEAWWLPLDRRLKYYDGTKYGKVNPKTGKRYFGRSLSQLTWDYNYISTGTALDVDLYRDPEQANDPATGAYIMVHFLLVNGFTALAVAGRWVDYRKRYNGRRAFGLADFEANVAALNNLLR